ncbi:MAG TPA: chromate transporter [Xanthobacteraceae bacterium]|nr:chromate transporter [Xanthobacteraceae bacterium]
MRNDADTLTALFLQFAILSFFAVGGGGSAVPEMHRQTVEIAQWLTDRQFSELFAIAQAAPGPNIMFVALLGHFIAGVPGAVVATVAMCGPSCVLAYAVSQVVERFRAARWRIAIQAGLVPVTIGLLTASALIIARAADHDWGGFAITAGTFAFVYWTSLSPLLAFAVAALLGLSGFA